MHIEEEQKQKDTEGSFALINSTSKTGIETTPSSSEETPPSTPGKSAEQLIEIISLFVGLIFNTAELSLSIIKIYKNARDSSIAPIPNGNAGELYLWRWLIALIIISIVSVLLGIINIILLIIAFIVYFHVVYQQPIVSFIFGATIIFGVTQITWVLLILILILIVLIYRLIITIKSYLRAHDVIHQIEHPAEFAVPLVDIENPYEMVHPRGPSDPHIELQDLPPDPSRLLSIPQCTMQ